MKKKINISACLILSQLSYASLAENINNQLEQVQQKLSSEQHKLNSVKKNKHTLQDKLKNDEQEISALTRSIRKIRKQRLSLHKKIAQLKKQVHQLNQKKKNQQQQLQYQVQQSYFENKVAPFAQALQNNPQKMDQLLIYYRYFNQARANKIKNIEKTEQKLYQAKNNLQKQQNIYFQLQKEKEKQSQSLNKTQAHRKKTIRKLAQRIQSRQEHLEFLEMEEAQLKKIIQTAQNNATLNKMKGLNHRKGILPWPTQGNISAHYGQSRGGQVRWKGVLIEADAGQPIKAIESGKVVYADWVKGLGMLTVIDHGNGFMSLYGHAQSLLKEVDDFIKADETIALVGNSGGLVKPHLYFEIRHKGKAVNPQKYLLSMNTKN